ncbi:major facilitator superfamily transporter [Hypoxylon trugodes]|uniref:major facilitator superfamily transporter n=1 Tax=Hypoxylon trugodes TaxID=326681 RepID=UPI00218E6047|nr:major facilitator superfamily transporter [Hypoxylon trugodes]KAI1387590.1 major facilitator superfamily transporter [Hypoxylon trugodes]
MMEITPTPLPTEAPIAMSSTAPAPKNETTMKSSGDGWRPTKRFLLAFMSLLTIVAAIAIESTSLPTALPIMSADLGGTALQAFWSGTSFLLASTVIQPTVASMSHILGRRMMLYFSSAGFAGGSLIAALAQNFNIVLIGRTVQGAGGGGLIVLLEILISDLVPLAHRGTWFSINSMMWGVGTATGPIIGAGFAQDISWRWIFWINLPIVGLGMLFVTLFLKQAQIPGDIAEKLKRFDWSGSVLFSASSASFLYGITSGGVRFPWSSYQALVPLVAGLVGMFCFVYWEFYFATAPIIDKRIFKTWTAISAYIQTMLHGLILWAAIYFLTLFYQAVKLYSPVTSAVALLPETVGLSLASVAVGVLTGITKRYRWALWSGWALTTTGAGLLYLLGTHTTVTQWVFLNIPFGIGTGMLFTAEILAIQAATEPELNGEAAGFFSFIRIFGQALGVAISGVIFQNSLKQKLLQIPGFASLADEYSRDATAIVALIQGMTDGNTKTQMIQAFSDALGSIWLSLLAFSATGLLLSMTVKGYSMAQEHVTSQHLVQEKDGAGNEEAGRTQA